MMQITTHDSYLTKLTRFGFVNAFLVREADGFTLIDTGISGSASAIIEAATQIGQPIRRIALTHAHADHVGSLDALHERLPDVEVSIGERDARFLTGDKSLTPDEQHDKLRGGFVVCTTMPDRLLKPGDKVGSLEVIASPGHTPGHISFFDPRNRALIAGDAFTTKSGVTTAGTLRLLFPFTAMATWSKSIGLRSAEELYSLQPSHLAVGHGKIVTNPLPAMQAAIAEAKRHIEKV
jgi:glyoxylase-like metal-dependent hydrolase (beta-lactamase superfamily II)